MATEPKKDPSEVDNGSFDSDRLWFDHLTARSTEAVDVDAAREANILRQAILLEHARELAEDQATRNPEADERQRQQLLFAARKAGLLGPSRPSLRQWTGWGAVAASVALGVVVFSSGPWRESGPYGEPPEVQMRGSGALVSISDTNPQARAEALAAALRAAGAQVQVFAKRGVYVVDVDLVPEQAEAIRSAALQQGVTLRPDYTRIQVAKP